MEYREDVATVLHYLSGEAGVRLMAGWRPGDGDVRPWLLSSSPASAELAARWGLPIAVAHHIRPDETVAAVARYRELFTPSRWADQPYVMVSVQTIVADTQREVERLVRPTDIARSQRFSSALLPPEQAAGYEIPEQVRSVVTAAGAVQAHGTIDTVRQRFAEIVQQTGADELMLFVPVYDVDARIRSYELAAKAAE